MFIDQIEMRLNSEKEEKRERIFWCLHNLGINIKPLETSFFSKKKVYGPTYLGISQPTLFIPFGKRLGIRHDRQIDGVLRDPDYPRATLASALASIPAQFLYDIFWATIYCLLAVPSLFAAVGFAIHAGLTDSENSKEIAYTALGNIVCAPYFVLAIVVDVSREILALATRTYATLTESPEGREQDYWYADNTQFKSANP